MKPTLAPLPRSLWFVRSKRDGLMEPRGFYTRKDARTDKRVKAGTHTVVGPYVLAERRGQE